MIQLMSNLSDKIGLLGVAFILLAYLLLSTAKIQSNSLKYHLLNFTGAWLILFSLYFHWNLASVVIEVAWIMISVVGIYRVVKA